MSEKPRATQLGPRGVLTTSGDLEAILGSPIRMQMTQDDRRWCVLYPGNHAGLDDQVIPEDEDC